MSIRRDRRARTLRLEFLESRLALSSFFVSPLGNDANPGTSSAPWLTLQKAAQSVHAGDTVDVRPGNYAGMDLWTGGTASQPIVFHAESGVTINAPNARTGDGINLEGASYVTIEGFNVVGMPRAGIRAVTDDHVTIRNNVTDRNGVWGIFTGFSDDLLIEGNVASNSIGQHGIYVSNSGDRPVIRNNTIFGNHDAGIHMNGDASMGGDGIISGALVEGNIVHDNGLGGGSAINADGVQNSVFQNNLLYNNHATGIALFQQDGGGGSSNNVVVNNTVIEAADSRYALMITGGSTGNTIENNILYNNSATRGSIDITSDSLAGLVSDYNVLMDRINVDDNFPLETVAQWQASTGQDRHSIVATPAQLFVNPAANDYHLLAGSPAVDRGTSQKAPSRDLDGNARPSGAGFDIGAYERAGAVAPGGAAAQYKFSETSGTTAADSSGNNQTATYVGSPTLGAAGVSSGATAVRLNGVNQYVSLPSTPFGAYGSDVSFETWFNAPAGASGVILSQTGGGSTPGGGSPNGYVPVVQLGTDGKLRSSMYWHGSVNSQLTSAGTATYNDGRWHHVAVTYASGVESLYIDGALAGQQNAGEVPYASAYSYYLGTGFTPGWAAGNSGWQFFSGTLDEAAVYQRALSAGEVAQHFSAVTINNPPVTPPSTGAAAQYSFGETSGSTAADNTGNGQAATYVGSPTLGVAGASSSTTAVRLNGINQYVSLPSAPFGAYGSAMSFETWFNAPVGSSGVILSQTGGGSAPGGGSPNGYVPVVQLGTDGKLRSSAFWHGSVSSQVTSSGAATYNDGHWHHVAVTYANGVESLYIDGALAGQQNAGEVPYASSYTYYLGTGFTAGWPGGNSGWQFFSGTLDEAAIYQRALSAAEVAQHYSSVSVSNPPVTPPSTAPVAQYHFGETSGTSAVDSTGNGQTATYVGNPTLGAAGVSGTTGVRLNGNNQYVALPSAAFGAYGNAVSFETWFNAPVGASGVILSQNGAGATPGGGSPNGYVPVVQLGTDGKLRSSMFWHGDVNARLTSPGTAAYNDGRWHHVAVTYANGVESLYIDGTLAGQQNVSQSPYASAYDFFLGTGYTGGWAAGNGGWQFFAGTLDEAAIYQRALSASEVAQHYAAVSSSLAQQNDAALAAVMSEWTLGLPTTSPTNRRI